MWIDAVRAAVGRSLERGSSGSPLTRAAERAWRAASMRGVLRPLHLPADAAVVGIGGATLGGAGKTPLSIELARALQQRGQRVAVVGHAYRARATTPRVVTLDDGVDHVGDDALYAARALAPARVPVVVAGNRQAALEHAASLADVLLVDGLLQARPLRLAAALLVADATTAAGTRCPPLGDLRAPWPAMRAAADALVRVLPEGDAEDEAPIDAFSAAALVARSRTVAAQVDDREVPLADLADQRVGLLLAIAHPARVERALARAGVVPRRVVALADHARAPGARLLGGVDVWLTTARCRTKLPGRLAGVPVGTLVHRLDVTALVEWLAPRLARTTPHLARHAAPRRGDASLAGSG